MKRVQECERTDFALWSPVRMPGRTVMGNRLQEAWWLLLPCSHRHRNSNSSCPSVPCHLHFIATGAWGCWGNHCNANCMVWGPGAPETSWYLEELSEYVKSLLWKISKWKCHVFLWFILPLNFKFLCYLNPWIAAVVKHCSHISPVFKASDSLHLKCISNCSM